MHTGLKFVLKCVFILVHSLVVALCNFPSNNLQICQKPKVHFWVIIYLSPNQFIMYLHIHDKIGKKVSYNNHATFYQYYSYQSLKRCVVLALPTTGFWLFPLFRSCWVEYGNSLIQNALSCFRKPWEVPPQFNFKSLALERSQSFYYVNGIQKAMIEEES